MRYTIYNIRCDVETTKPQHDSSYKIRVLEMIGNIIDKYFISEK